MKNKYDICIENIKNNNILICPLCQKDLGINNHSLRCDNNHNYDISKKGEVFLVNSSNYKLSPIYDSKLFMSRRDFINKNYYSNIYDDIANYINSLGKDYINILDLGSGEGTHMHKIIEKLKVNYNLISIDYSKDAIKLATDYTNNNICIVGDINNLPIKSNSLDIIIDFLSPYSGEEIKRVLKDDGKLIKVVPGDSYLKELREELYLEDYKKKDEVKNNILKYFNIIKEVEIDNIFSIDDDDLNNLIRMSPLKSSLKDKKVSIDKITINNIIYYLECK